jgi:hypothetical protein
VINDDKTIGGFARVGAVIAERRKARQGQGPVLVLDAGDYSMGTAFGAAIRETGGELQLLFQRLAVSDVAAERSAELSAASDVLAAHGADELATAVAAGAVAKDAAEAGVAEIAAGAEEVGKGKAAVVAGEAMQERAAQ